MTRILAGLTIVFVAVALVALPTAADDRPQKLTPQERKELEAKRVELNTAAIKAFGEGKYPEAQKAFEDALAVARRLYPKDEFPGGHANLAVNLSNLAMLLQAQGKLAEAEPLSKEALEMTR